MYYHLVGINGISMSGLAKILEKLGHRVSGCDIEGRGHNPDHITKDLDALIISAAITPSSKGWIEVEKARELNIPIITRSRMVGYLMQERQGIAVAGMHGKTTVSGMITSILEEAKYDPSFLIGGNLPKLGNAKLGKGKYFVVEACEYARQFLDLMPRIAVITNIEKEHLDTYPGGLPEIKKAFKKFVKLIPNSGLLVIWEDDPTTPWLLKTAQCRVKTFSLNKPWAGLRLRIPGQHNILNATAAARVCHEIGVSHEIIKKVLNNFTGVQRRFEIKGEINGALVIDDYAHHPSEIQATLKAAKEFYPKKRIICVFQPHQYSRTRWLLKEFVNSFANCDMLIVAQIYVVPGRDTKEEINTKDFVKEVKKSSQKNVVYTPTDNEILKFLKKEIKTGDLIITMGATKIYKVGEKLLEQL